MAYDWKTNSNEKIGNVNVHCREYKKYIVQSLLCGNSLKILFLDKGQGLIVIDPGGNYKGFSDI